MSLMLLPHFGVFCDLHVLLNRLVQHGIVLNLFRLFNKKECLLNGIIYMYIVYVCPLIEHIK